MEPLPDIIHLLLRTCLGYMKGRTMEDHISNILLVLGTIVFFSLYYYFGKIAYLILGSLCVVTLFIICAFHCGTEE